MRRNQHHLHNSPILIKGEVSSPRLALQEIITSADATLLSVSGTRQYMITIEQECSKNDVISSHLGLYKNFGRENILDQTATGSAAFSDTTE